jgi:hypothetical protein
VNFFLASVTKQKEGDALAKAVTKKAEGDAVIWLAYPERTPKYDKTPR